MDQKLDHRKEVFLTLRYSLGDEDYGFHINDSTYPVSVSDIVSTSPAAAGGLMDGDKLMTVNGHNVTRMPSVKIRTIFSYCRNSPITVKVLRVCKEDGQTEDSSVVHNSVVNPLSQMKPQYEQALDDALRAVDILSADFASESNKLSKTDAVKIKPSASSSAMLVHSGLEGIMENVNQLVESTSENSFASTEATNTSADMSTCSQEEPTTIDLVVQEPPVTTGTSPFSSPPPIPPYNPKTPDKFLLSNKPEYQIELKRQLHYYEDVDLPGPREPKPKPSAGTQNQSISPEKEEHGGTVATNLNLKGLPPSVHTWKVDHVMKWLQQLSPLLFDQYSNNFHAHDVSGHTLLHLNESKLLSMGITDQKDRIQLAMYLANLHMMQEYTELQKLSDQVSWL